MLTIKTDRWTPQVLSIALLCAFAALPPALAQQQPGSPVSPAHPITGAPQTAPPMGMSIGLVAPLVIESADWASVLTLVNESKTPVHAQIVLHTAEDMMSVAPSHTMELPGHSSRRVAVRSLLNRTATDFIGSLAVNIQEPDAAKNMAAAAQVAITAQGDLTGTSVDEELQMPMMGNFNPLRKDPLAFGHSKLRMENATAMVTCVAQGRESRIAENLPAKYQLSALSFVSLAGGRV